MVTDVTRLPIRFDGDRVAAFCRARGIVRLSLFGSVLRDDFDPIRSDIDVLADFKPEATRGIGFRFFGYGDELAGILGRKVDFCSRLDPRLVSVGTAIKILPEPFFVIKRPKSAAKRSALIGTRAPRSPDAHGESNRARAHD